MSQLLDTLIKQAATRQEVPFLRCGRRSLSFAETLAETETLAAGLDGRALGLLMDNGPAWAVADLAAIRSNLACVPIPPFFSPGQMRHCLADAGVDRLLTDRPESVTRLVDIPPDESVELAGVPLALFRLPTMRGASSLKGVAKVTYTSGTTGAPKGVCLTLKSMEQVARSLATVIEAGTGDRALSLLPLSTLLENIGTLYAPLLAGGEAVLPSMSEIGLSGASTLDPSKLLAALGLYRPTSIILVPQLLQALVESVEAGTRLPDTLRFMAVGGAPTAPSLLQRADRLGLPVYEGYGLSEAASVVTVNTPGRRRIGSVGKPLPHIRVGMAEDGEIELKGGLFQGYLGGEIADSDDFWATGDLGHLDEEGFLYLTGRKKNLFVTAFGRNVAPEWVECELQQHSAIAQSAVFGEARPYNVAIIVPRGNSAPLGRAVEMTNERLPDYARISKYLIADEPFTLENGQLTATGRPRRHNIQRRYAEAIARLY